MVLSAFVGDFKMIHQENLDQLLEALGVRAPLRALAKTSSIRLHITMEGQDHWSIHVTGLKDNKFDFNMGSEFEHVTTDGRKVKSTFKADGPNKVIETEEWDGKTALHIYEIDDDLLTMTIEFGNVRCIRKFQRI